MALCDSAVSFVMLSVWLEYSLSRRMFSVSLKGEEEVRVTQGSSIARRTTTIRRRCQTDFGNIRRSLRGRGTDISRRHRGGGEAFGPETNQACPSLPLVSISHANARRACVCPGLLLRRFWVLAALQLNALSALSLHLWAILAPHWTSRGKGVRSGSRAESALEAWYQNKSGGSISEVFH